MYFPQEINVLFPQSYFSLQTSLRSAQLHDISASQTNLVPLTVLLEVLAKGIVSGSDLLLGSSK